MNPGATVDLQPSGNAGQGPKFANPPSNRPISHFSPIRQDSY